MQDALELALGMPHDESIFFLGTDVLDAFHQIPLRREEWRFTGSEFMGKFYIFKVLVFGSGSAPTI